MKKKLTLSIEEKAITNVKRIARQRRKSVSQIIEEKYAVSFINPKKKAAQALLEHIRKTKPVKSIPDKKVKQMRAEYLKKKHG